MTFSEAHNDFLNLKYGNNDYIMHHGIKGQKWGIRRYQNEDGSLTPEGRKRYLKYSNSDELNQKGLRKLDTKKYNKYLNLQKATKENRRKEFISNHKDKFNKLFDEMEKIAKYNYQHYGKANNEKKPFLISDDYLDLVEKNLGIDYDDDPEAVSFAFDEMYKEMKKRGINRTDW